MGFFKSLFCKKKDSNAVETGRASSLPRASSEMLYYINIPEETANINEFGEIVRNTKDVAYGPFTLSELKIEYGEYLTADMLISTDTLNGEWYEAQCFECFDDLFNAQQGFRINEFGEIVRR